MAGFSVSLLKEVCQDKKKLKLERLSLSRAFFKTANKANKKKISRLSFTADTDKDTAFNRSPRFRVLKLAIILSQECKFLGVKQQMSHN